MTTEEIQLQSFQIIAGVGCARSCYIDAIHLARDGKFEEAEAKRSPRASSIMPRVTRLTAALSSRRLPART